MRDDGRRDVDRQRDADVPERSIGGRYRRIPAQFSPLVYGGWSAAWITAFAMNLPWLGLPMMLLTGALSAVVEHSPKRQRYRRNRWYPGSDGPLVPPWQQQPPPRPGSRLPDPVPAPAPEPPTARPKAAAPSPEQRLATAVIRAETSGGRLDADALELVRELDRLLRPMLAQLRGGDGDAAVRHDVEAIAADHLPAVVDAFLAMPGDYAHEHRDASGASPADEFRSQLTLLVAGCRQLRDAMREADVARQQQLSRFLEAKFRRGDLDL